MNTNKFNEFFSPESCRSRVHIIGCGATGSTLAESLVRCGITPITLYDFDTVTEHNIANQIYTAKDIYKPKLEALKAHLCDINPDLEQSLKLVPKGYTGQPLSGYIFMCVDNVATRKLIVKENLLNPTTKLIIDIRMRLTDAQIYASNWEDEASKEYLQSTLNYTQEEADADTPKSSCNLTLSICPTVRIAAGYATSVFIKYLRKDPIPKLTVFDAFHFTFNSFC